ncbi:hypothetical protein [Roseateles sp. P5_E1]
MAKGPPKASAEVGQDNPGDAQQQADPAAPAQQPTRPSLVPAQVAPPAPLPRPVNPAPPIQRGSRAPAGNVGQGGGMPHRDYFPWILGIVVTITLLCLFMALYESRIANPNEQSKQLFSVLVDIFKIGCGAVIGLLGGRKA